MKRLIIFLVTVGYVGRLPKGPGTAGSLVAVIVILVLAHPVWIGMAFVVSALLGLWLCKPAVHHLGEADPQSFVLDEFAGMMTAMLFLPIRPELVIAAFFLFRFFDIVKPLGIRKLERIHHPMSIMLDDLLAGVYTNLILQSFLYFTK